MSSAARAQLAVGKSNPAWQRVTFGDVVRQVKLSVEPSSSGLERYVAGEHMDTDDLRIRRWGVIGAPGYLGPAFHRRFSAGDVLYGSRRTYLRKVAVADFDGVCANTTFVCAPADARLLSEFLPIVMQTEAFHANSIGKSKGGVTPYINWGDIASFEFFLPSDEEQKRIAELVRAADETIQAQEQVVVATKLALNASLAALLERRDWTERHCSEVLRGRLRNGVSITANDEGRGLPTLSIGAIQDGRVVADGYTKYADVDRDTVEPFLLQPGDVLVVRGNGNRGLTGRCGLVTEAPDDCFYPDLLIRLVFDDDELRPEFGALQWNSPFVQRELTKRAKSTNGIWKVNGKDVGQQRLRVPPLPVQDEFLRRVDAVRQLERAAQARLAQGRHLRVLLLNGLAPSA